MTINAYKYVGCFRKQYMYNGSGSARRKKFTNKAIKTFPLFSQIEEGTSSKTTANMYLN